jgi:hypothetical protein
LEDAGYGFSTDACDERLWELFTRAATLAKGEGK